MMNPEVGNKLLNSALQSEELDPCLHDQNYVDNIKELQLHLDMVKKIARPGCSREVLNLAWSSMSSVVKVLSTMSSKTKPHSSL